VWEHVQRRCGRNWKKEAEVVGGGTVKRAKDLPPSSKMRDAALSLAFFALHCNCTWRGPAHAAATVLPPLIPTTPTGHRSERHDNKPRPAMQQRGRTTAVGTTHTKSNLKRCVTRAGDCLHLLTYTFLPFFPLTNIHSQTLRATSLAVSSFSRSIL
jgi:hypothetical protein